MGIEELSNTDYESCLCQLTEQDVLNAKKMIDSSFYGSIVRYMLDKNVKLEQEVISYELMKSYNNDEGLKNSR